MTSPTPRLASISLTSTDSNTMSLSSYRTNTTTSAEDLPDSTCATSPITPMTPKSPFSPRACSPMSPSGGCSPISPRSPRRGSRNFSPSPGTSPTRRGGNLGLLASRRSSRDSEASEVAPLNYARYKRRRPSNFLELPIPDHFRPRVCSLPEAPYNPRDADELYRLRSFSITPKGVLVNQGDHILSKRIRSNTSVTSQNSSRRSSAASTTLTVDSPTRRARTPGATRETSIDVFEDAVGSPRDRSSLDELTINQDDPEDDWFNPQNLINIRKGSSPGPRVCASGERSPYDSSCGGTSYLYSEGPVPKYRVVLLGESGVGKTSLVTQFMTSDYINTYDASLDDEFGEKSVSVLLDSEESEVIFIDHPAHEMAVENMLATYDPHACVVVYSITDKSSFKKAEDIMNYLWRENATKEKAVIICGNKVDLARARTVSIAAGKSLASCHDSKFIETSSGIQHNVDELLVGIVKQIRLRLSSHRKQMKKASTSRTSLSLHAAKELLSKMCLMDNKSKSCENLHVL